MAEVPRSEGLLGLLDRLGDLGIYGGILSVDTQLGGFACVTEAESESQDAFLDLGEVLDLGAKRISVADDVVVPDWCHVHWMPPPS
ncbi:MAG: hypothetical protein HUU02_01640 [Bacteroidetes bacterium]|nr:hypothetical protein [Bacteroidota bacterium]